MTEACNCQPCICSPACACENCSCGPACLCAVIAAPSTALVVIAA